MEREPKKDEAGTPSTRDWERLWLAIQRSSWMSIALVPIGEGMDTPALAAALADVGQKHLGARVLVHDSTKVTISTLPHPRSQRLGLEPRETNAYRYSGS